MTAPIRCGPPRITSGSYDMPTEQSARCTWWLARIAAGWRPNRRISGLGYYTASEWFGVWIWEYLNVIYPVIESSRRDDMAAASDAAATVAS